MYILLYSTSFLFSFKPSNQGRLFTVIIFFSSLLLTIIFLDIALRKFPAQHGLNHGALSDNHSGIFDPLLLRLSLPLLHFRKLFSNETNIRYLKLSLSQINGCAFIFHGTLTQELREQLTAEQQRSRMLVDRLQTGEAQSRHTLALVQMQYESKMRVRKGFVIVFEGIQAMQET